MNRSYDYNGVVVSASRPNKVLRTVKKTIHIDSGDRDTFKYYTNGDFMVYLPRNYPCVTSIRLKDAQFPPLVSYGGFTPVVTAPTAQISTSTGYVTYTVSGSTAGMSVGQTVTIAGATATITSGPGINGTFTIVSIPSTTTFTVRNNTVTSTTISWSSGSATLLAPGAATHSFNASGSNGQNIPSATYVSDTILTAPAPYFLINLEGLNKTDELAINANRSTYSDGFFAKIPATTTTYGASTFINYNDHSALENIAVYSPPIENLDRLRITTRLHSQQDKSGFLYWTTDGAVAAAAAAGTNLGTGADFNMTLEIEYMDNAFTDFSTFETRIAEQR